MAEQIRDINHLRGRRDFAPGIVVDGMRRLSDVTQFINRLINVNYAKLSVGFIGLPRGVQAELDSGELQPKQVPARLLVPGNRDGRSPRVDRLTAKIIRPDLSLTDTDEANIQLGKIITVDFRGRLRFFDTSHVMPSQSAGDISRKFTFFTLEGSPGVLKIGFGRLDIVYGVSPVTSQEVQDVELILAKRLATELSRDASARLRGLEALKKGIMHPLQGGAVESGASKSSRRKH